MPKVYISKKGYKRMRGTTALKLQKEIRQLFEVEHMSIPDICAQLQLAKGVAITTLYGSKQNSKRLAQIVTDATLDAIVGFGELMETIRMELTHNKIRSSLGQLNWTPEQLGTAVRSAEKYVDIIKLVNGRELTYFKDAKESNEKQDPRMDKAQERLRQLQAVALSGAPIDVTPKPEEEPDGD